MAAIPQIPTGRSQNLKILVLSGVTAVSGFLALNGRDFGINAHLAVNTTTTG
jgi:hypothetical protein